MAFCGKSNTHNANFYQYLSVPLPYHVARWPAWGPLRAFEESPILVSCYVAHHHMITCFCDHKNNMQVNTASYKSGVETTM